VTPPAKACLEGPSTEQIWYFDLSDIKMGKKTPLTVKHFEEAGFFDLLRNRGDSQRSWTVSRQQIESKNYDLKAVNLNTRATEDRRTPEELLDLIEAKGQEVAQALAQLRHSTTDLKQHSTSEPVTSRRSSAVVHQDHAG
jgi:type I restriction enzyme M protein